MKNKILLSYITAFVFVLLMAQAALARQAQSISRSLYAEAAKGNDAKVRKLLADGAQINFVHFGNQSTPLLQAALHGHASTVALLLRQGANINSRDAEGEDALLKSVHSGQLAVCQILLEHNANPNTHDDIDNTSLALASAFGNSHIVKYLLQYPIEVNAQNKDGMTPLMYASKQGYADIVRLLLSHKAHGDTQDRDGKTSLTYACSLSRLYDGSLTGTRQRDTMLHGYVKCAQLLLVAGANVNIRDDDGKAPLNVAAYTRHDALIRLLLAHGANVNNADANGTTPFMIYPSPLLLKSNVADY